MPAIRFATVGLADDLATTIAQKLAGRADQAFGRAGLDAGRADVERFGVGVVFLGTGDDFEGALATAAQLKAATHVVLVAAGLDVDELRSAMRVGCREVVDPTSDLDLVPEIVSRLSLDPRQVPTYGQVTVVHGCAGGVGATFMAISLARLMAGDRGRKVVLLDLSPIGGDVADTLDVKRFPNTHSVVQSLDDWDSEKAQGAFHREPVGYWVLARPTEDEQLEPLDGPQAIALVAWLATHFTDVIVDTGAGLGAAQREVLHVADRVVLVSTQSVTSVRSLVRRRATLSKLDVPLDQTAVVLNLYDARLPPNKDQLVDQLGVSMVATVSADPTLLHSATMDGDTVMTVAPKSKVAREVAVVKAKLLGEEAPPPERKWLRMPWD